MNDLSERKLKILDAIVNDYITSGDPVGSRTIAKNYELGVSSATIRNEMSDLEDLGLIIQPHASAGRVPSDKGYRLYVNNILNNANKSKVKHNVSFLNDIIANNINRIEDLMEETAKAVALLTNYVTIVSEPESEIKTATIKHLQLVPVDDSSVLLVMILNSNMVRNSMIPFNGEVIYNYTMNDLNALSDILNQSLKGITIENITNDLVNEMIRKNNGDGTLIILIIKKIKQEALKSNMNRIHASGVNNLLEYPEFASNVDKTREVFKTIEQKELLGSLLANSQDENFEIVIGSENSIVEMKDFSIIKARYNLGNNRYGNIGIVGPTRMNYEDTINMLNNIVSHINLAIEKIDQES